MDADWLYEHFDNKRPIEITVAGTGTVYHTPQTWWVKGGAIFWCERRDHFHASYSAIPLAAVIHVWQPGPPLGEEPF